MEKVIQQSSLSMSSFNSGSQLFWVVMWALYSILYKYFSSAFLVVAVHVLSSIVSLHCLRLTKCEVIVRLRYKLCMCKVLTGSLVNLLTCSKYQYQVSRFASKANHLLIMCSQKHCHNQHVSVNIFSLQGGCRMDWLFLF